jgi:hypothetical protein
MGWEVSKPLIEGLSQTYEWIANQMASKTNYDPVAV